ncbi:hypothetical protein [Mesorhizobium sp. M0058]|uniref:hypothetical protein n=1 Tax=Mesorhizobium sp. M0058 TaxID=2956865 RepID=UPI003339FAA7
MCNVYNITTSQDAIRERIRAMPNLIGNIELSLDVYAEQEPEKALLEAVKLAA